VTRPRRRLEGLALLLVLWLALWGCAAPRPAQVIPPAPPGPSAPAPVPSAPVGAGRDSSPTPEALAVLATLPEPLAPAPAAYDSAARGGARAPTRPAPAESAPARPAPPETADTLRAEAPAADVPVPAPTSPLGSGPTVLPATPPPPVAAPPPAAPDTCWRVQVGAPLDRVKGRSLRDAAESLLMVPMIVDREGGRFKVRTRDCLSHEAAERLKGRAVDSGFKGVFLVRLPGPR
jgi:hypothetical protein